MTTLTILVENGHEEDLKKILQSLPYKVEIKSIVPSENTQLENGFSPYEKLVRIQKLMEQAKRKDLFKDIKDPSEWQREIRKEWDRDF